MASNFSYGGKHQKLPGTFRSSLPRLPRGALAIALLVGFPAGVERPGSLLHELAISDPIQPSPWIAIRSPSSSAPLAIPPRHLPSLALFSPVAHVSTKDRHH